MGTKRMLVFLFRAVTVSGFIALFAASAVAKATLEAPGAAHHGVAGIVDARHGGRAVKLTVSQPARGKQLTYLNLSQPEATQAACCIATGKRLSKAQAGREVWAGTLSRRAANGFFGIALVRAPQRIERTSPNEIVLSWRATRTVSAAASVRVIHCVSSEGFNVRVVDASKGAAGTELNRYYVPLGMDVEPDCTPALMPPG
jgi:hypothetical protein